jgi:hypothetical protein
MGQRIALPKDNVGYGAGRAIPGAKAEWSRRWISIVDWSVPHVGKLCRFLGRLHDVAIHVRRRQASEKRQGTKSRLAGSGGCSRLYGDLAAAGVAAMVHWGTGLGGSDGQQGIGGQLDEWKGRRGVGRRLL